MMRFSSSGSGGSKQTPASRRHTSGCIGQRQLATGLKSLTTQAVRVAGRAQAERVAAPACAQRMPANAMAGAGVAAPASLLGLGEEQYFDVAVRVKIGARGVAQQRRRQLIVN